MNKGYWLSAATSKIRFAPDRAAVYREQARALAMQNGGEK